MKSIILNIGRAIGYAFFGLLVWALFWLYLLATPDQMSAEYDLAVEEGRAAEY